MTLKETSKPTGMNISELAHIEDIKMIELPTTYPVGPVNVFLLFGEKLTLIDTGNKLEKAWDALNEGLHQHGVRLTDIEQIVLTHHHADHIDMLDWIMEKHPVPVYAHPNCRPFLEKDPVHLKWRYEFFESFYREFGLQETVAKKIAKFNSKPVESDRVLPLDLELNEGDAIPGLPGWTVLETLGHAQSHLSLYRPSDGTLICGDHLIKHSSSGLFMEASPVPYDERPKPLIQYIRDLKKLRNLPIKLTMSGHGDWIENTAELIDERLTKIERKVKKVMETLDQNGKTGYELIQDLYSDIPRQMLVLYAFDSIGILDVLLERGEIEAEKSDGVIKYKLI